MVAVIISKQYVVPNETFDDLYLKYGSKSLSVQRESIAGIYIFDHCFPLQVGRIIGIHHTTVPENKFNDLDLEIWVYFFVLLRSIHK